MGCLAGILQFIFNVLQIRFQKHGLFSNNVFYNFALQGFAGGIISAAFVALSGNQTAFDFSTLQFPYKMISPTGQVVGTAISMGIGLIGGLVAGLLITPLNKETEYDHFHDQAYWIINSDGIS